MGANRNSDVSKTAMSNGKLQGPNPFQMMLRAMENDASAEDSEFTGDDLLQILSAESMEEMWDADERPPLNFQHLAGCNIAILDFEVKYGRGGAETKSYFTTPEGKQMYLLVKCVRLSDPDEKSIIMLPPIGEEFQANTSARFIVAKIWRAHTLGEIRPVEGISLQCAVKEIDLGNNTAVLKLRPLSGAKQTVQSGTVG